MAFIVIFIVVLVVAGLISMAHDSAQKAENEEFENSMSDFKADEKYHSLNNQVGMLYDKEKLRARIIYYNTKYYEDVDCAELGIVHTFFTTIVFTDKKNDCIIYASFPLNTNKRKEEMKLQILKINGFRTSKLICNKKDATGFGAVKTGLEPCLMIDNQNRKILFLHDIDEINNRKDVCFSDIISVEIIENGTTTFSKSTTRTIGGALVGNALMGGAGAVVGGLSGNTKKTDKVDSISVKILVRDVDNPTIMINLHKGSDIDTNKDDYKNLKEFANEIKDVISVIIDAEDKAANTKMEQPSNTNITDELMKIAKLKEDGLLTDEEFAKMKSKLLNS